MTAAAAPTAQPHDTADTLALLATATAVGGGALLGLGGTGSGLPVAPQLHGTLGEFAGIAANNIIICALLILCVDVPALRSRWAANVIDVLAALALFPAAASVGLVLMHPAGPALLLHAPIELAAVALAASWAWQHRTRPARSATELRLATVTTLLLLAAAVETFAVPHV